MEKFDEALDKAKLCVMGLRSNNITRTQVALEEIIHAIDLLADEVAKLKEYKEKNNMALDKDGGDYIFDTINIPKEVLDAAILIDRYFAQQGIVKWELYNICSRNHAYQNEAGD